MATTTTTTAPAPPLVKKPSLTEVPQIWGHRGASAAYPENTLASFEAAIRDGAEGIESDIHITKDHELVMIHDTSLDRTTNGTGYVQQQAYHGVLDKLVTIEQPSQKIPTFRETVELLTRPENSKVFLNIDVKVSNDPEILFSLMNEIISAVPNYKESIAPRLVLGLWHPKYVEPARRLLPYLGRVHIGMSPALARKYFWDACSGFSMNFSCLVGSDGENFRKECKAAGKDLYVWTVNKRTEMIEAAKWGAKAVLTDRTADAQVLRAQMAADWEAVSRETSWRFGWTSIWYTSFANFLLSSWELHVLTKAGGQFKVVTAGSTTAL